MRQSTATCPDIAKASSTCCTFRPAFTIGRTLTKKLGTPESRRGVGYCLNNSAVIEEACGDPEAALTKYKESLDISRKLAEEIGTKEVGNGLI